MADKNLTPAIADKELTPATADKELTPPERLAILRYMWSIIAVPGILFGVVCAGIGWFIKDYGTTKAYSEALNQLVQQSNAASTSIGEAKGKLAHLDDEIASMKKQLETAQAQLKPVQGIADSLSRIKEAKEAADKAMTVLPNAVKLVNDAAEHYRLGDYRAVANYTKRQTPFSDGFVVLHTGGDAKFDEIEIYVEGVRPVRWAYGPGSSRLMSLVCPVRAYRTWHVKASAGGTPITKDSPTLDVQWIPIGPDRPIEWGP